MTSLEDPTIATMDGTLSPEQRQAATSAFNTMVENVNLDEVTLDEVRIAFVEFEEVVEDGVKKRKPRVRHLTLSTYVPNRLFNQMLARLQKARKEHQGRVPETAMAEIMSEAVLSVWKLSEPEMTLERLNDGLDLPRIVKLFNLFFGSMSGKIMGRGA